MGRDVVLLAVLCFIGACHTLAIPGVKTTEHFNQSEILDTEGNYLLFWNFNKSHVTFEVHVKTTGWVGFGFSDNGNMFPADIVIGWVSNDGTTHFTDRHTTGHVMPVKDASQDWHLLHGAENEFGTVLKFVRKMDTCDTSGDMKIQEGTSRLIYAYGKDDPASDDAIPYHGTTRGTKSVGLFDTSEVPETLPTDLIYYDFFNENFLMPNDTTTYWCKGFKMPELGKHHMIKFEPVVTPGNEMNVHHILVYQCRIANPESYHGKAGDCYHQRPKDLPQCGNLILAWAIGGKSYYFPKSVGFPIGENNDQYLYMTETHYDNPHRRTGVLDNSGLRITMTQTLRSQDAGVLWVGAGVNNMQVVPPHEKAFVSKGYCSQDCMNDVLTSSNVTEIKVFAAMQHAHLLGEAITTRHFRNGVELESIINEPNYDFNFQQTVHLPKEKIIRATDSLRVDCIYNSMNYNRPVFGGLSTEEEMCISFLYYYPRVPVSKCISTQTYEPFVNSSKEAYELYSRLDWDNSTAVAEVKANWDKALVKHKCYGDNIKFPLSDMHTYFVEKETDHPYVAPKTAACSG